MPGQVCHVGHLLQARVFPDKLQKPVVGEHLAGDAHAGLVALGKLPPVVVQLYEYLGPVHG